MGRYKEIYNIINGKNKLSSPLTVPLFFLHVCGVWPNEETFSNLWYISYAIFVTTFFSITHTLLQIINFAFIYQDVQLIASSLYIVLSDIVGIVKVVLFIKNNRILKKVIKTIDSELFKPKTDQQKQLMQDYINFLKVVLEIFWIFVICTGAGWGLYPLLDKLSREEQRLPFLSWYPFNYKKPQYFALTFIYQLIAVHFIAMVNIPGDSLFAALMTYTAGQCAVLSDNLRNISEYTRQRLQDKNLISASSKNSDDEEIIQQELSASFVELIRYHREILLFADDCNKFMDPIAISQFATTVLVLCITMFQLTLVAPFSAEFFALVFYQTAIFIQILMYCWFGNEALIQSTKIADAIYESQWVDAPLSFKKEMLFFMCRTQWPIKFKALNFFTFSLETFSWIVRSSWSYFAVLRTSNKS